MNLAEMIALINANVDDVVDTTVAIQWLNAGQNQMAVESRASFPQITSDTSSTFVFPEKYHEIPVLYACAMYQSSESSVGEKNSYLVQYQEGLKSFIENYDVPIEYRDDTNTQQFVKTSTDENTYTITKRGYSNYSNLKVYRNNIQTSLFTTNENSFTLSVIVGKQEPVVGDKITAVWEDRPEMQEPPYTWWKAW